MRKRIQIPLLLTLLLSPAAFAQTAAYTPPTATENRAAATPTSDPTWWKRAVIYSVFTPLLSEIH